MDADAEAAREARASQPPDLRQKLLARLKT